MKPVVAVDAYLHKEALESLESTCQVLRCQSGTEGIHAARDARAVAVILGATRQFSASVMDQIPTLIVIARPGIGVDNVDIQAAIQRGIAVVNAPDGPTVSTAEHTLALILALAKRHKPAVRLLSAGASFTSEPMLAELRGSVLGLVGLGRIGRRMAHMCGMGLGMQVVGYDPYVVPEVATEYGVSLCSDLHDVLRIADFVSLHCPANETTRRMINARTLAEMKPTAFLINCARGAIVDEAALIAALKSGQIAGAGLDVFDPEPPSPSNPLLAMENVVATPHTAGFTEACLREIGLGAVQGVLAVLAGERPPALVNPEVWDSPARRRGTWQVS